MLLPPGRFEGARRAGAFCGCDTPRQERVLPPGARGYPDGDTPGAHVRGGAPEGELQETGRLRLSR
jgi:hypothetical protein